MSNQQYTNSYSITTISDTREDKIYKPANSALGALLNSRLSGISIMVTVRNTKGQALMCKYDFSNIRSVSHISAIPNQPGCDDVLGPVLNAGQDVDTFPECCPTCVAPYLTAVPGTGKWEKLNDTPTTESCFKRVSFDAVYTRRPGSGGDSLANQTLTRTGIINLMVPYQLNTIENLRDTKLKSGTCDDCYC